MRRTWYKMRLLPFIQKHAQPLDAGFGRGAVGGRSAVTGHLMLYLRARFFPDPSTCRERASPQTWRLRATRWLTGGRRPGLWLSGPASVPPGVCAHDHPSQGTGVPLPKSTSRGVHGAGRRRGLPRSLFQQAGGVGFAGGATRIRGHLRGLRGAGRPRGRAPVSRTGHLVASPHSTFGFNCFSFHFLA